MRRETVADQGLSILRSRILDGDLRPGDAVTEEAMARDIGVSRPTMREVLTILVGEGLLTRHPSTRILQVTTLTSAEVTEIYAARRILESAGVDGARQATAEERGRLEDTIREMEAAVADNDLYALVQADSRCHAETVALTRSRHLCALHDQLMAKLNLTLSQVESDQPSDNAELLRLHREYVELMLGGDTEAAKTQLLLRLDAAEKDVLEGLRRQETAGKTQRRTLPSARAL
ncbi:GntR family transcriptional regulator [Ornithinimicrobium murale]|uniref:GntR family transcriptional regulator n=1 Tax=Ornithinimicrobium murale TaxID=1050153 RepID=UPI0013B3AD43|nr:GntR family transcriptional regulator [Ornithinimicrobium murale]